MAIDTRDKRASAGACALVWLVALPTPDSTISAADRAHSAGFYAGIAAGTPSIIDLTQQLSAALDAATTSITLDSAVTQSILDSVFRDVDVE